MNNDEVLHEQPLVVHDLGHEAHEHHHKETFITKYVFSQDHKMISKQFLITGMIWALIGGLFSVIFRLQLGYPDQTFPFLEDLLGHWARGGKLDQEFYYSLVTMHGTILVFFVLTAGLSGTFANFLIPLRRRQGYGFAIFEHAFLLVFLVGFRSYVFLLICANRSCKRRLDDISAVKCARRSFRWLQDRDGSLAGEHRAFYNFSIIGRVKLYFYHIEHAHQRDEHDPDATYGLVPFLHRGTGSIVVPGFIIRRHIVAF